MVFPGLDALAGLIVARPCSSQPPNSGAPAGALNSGARGRRTGAVGAAPLAVVPAAAARVN